MITTTIVSKMFCKHGLLILYQKMVYVRNMSRICAYKSAEDWHQMAMFSFSAGRSKDNL